MPRTVDTVGDWYYFPLGIAYVSAAMKAQGFHISTLNLNNIPGDIETIIRDKIIEEKIEIVATGGLTFQINSIKNILRVVKKIDPTIPVIVGGGIITSAPIAAMKALELADFGVVGEGEITNGELTRALEDGSSVCDIRGIVYRHEGEYVVTPSRPEITDLDTLPFPDYEGFGFEKILERVASLQGINEKNTITMLSSRSCPYRCTFCFHSSGKKYRQRSLDNFFQELDLLVSKYGIKYLFIADELFAHDKERVKEFCSRIKQYNIKWWAQFRVSDVTQELVEMLKDSNCATMGFGIESADNRILKSMKKYITIENTEKALELVYNAGIGIQGGLIFGDVEETIETASNSIEWWKRNSRYGLTLNFISIYPGTPLYINAVKNGIIENEVNFINAGCPVINVSKMTHEERSWLGEQVVTLPQQGLQEPLNISNVLFDLDKGVISLTGECASCGNSTRWDTIRFFTRNVLQCSRCGRKHKIPILPELIQRIDRNLQEALANYGKIVCWGVNDYFTDIVRCSDVLKHENVFFVDRSEFKQGSKISGKEIFSPQIIETLNIEFVVIPVVAFFPVISGEIETCFRSVKKVVNITEMFME